MQKQKNDKKYDPNLPWWVVLDWCRQPMIYDVETDLSLLEMHILAVLYRYCEKAGDKPFPTIDTIAKKVASNRKTVSRAVDALVDRKWLDREKVEMHKGRFRWRYDLQPATAKLFAAPKKVFGDRAQRELAKMAARIAQLEAEQEDPSAVQTPVEAAPSPVEKPAEAPTADVPSGVALEADWRLDKSLVVHREAASPKPEKTAEEQADDLAEQFGPAVAAMRKAKAVREAKAAADAATQAADWAEYDARMRRELAEACGQATEDLTDPEVPASDVDVAAEHPAPNADVAARRAAEHAAWVENVDERPEVALEDVLTVEEDPDADQIIQWESTLQKAA